MGMGGKKINKQKSFHFEQMNWPTEIVYQIFSFGF